MKRVQRKGISLVVLQNGKMDEIKPLTGTQSRNENWDLYWQFVKKKPNGSLKPWKSFRVAHLKNDYIIINPL